MEVHGTEPPITIGPTTGAPTRSNSAAQGDAKPSTTASSASARAVHSMTGGIGFGRLGFVDPGKRVSEHAHDVGRGKQAAEEHDRHPPPLALREGGIQQQPFPGKPAARGQSNQAHSG